MDRYQGGSARVLTLTLILFAPALASAAPDAALDAGAADSGSGSAYPDLGSLLRDFDYPDTECGCPPPPVLQHPDFGLYEGGAADAAAPDASGADSAVDLGSERDGAGDGDRDSAPDGGALVTNESGCQAAPSTGAAGSLGATLAVLALLALWR